MGGTARHARQTNFQGRDWFVAARLAVAGVGEEPTAGPSRRERMSRSCKTKPKVSSLKFQVPGRRAQASNHPTSQFTVATCWKTSDGVSQVYHAKQSQFPEPRLPRRWAPRNDRDGQGSDYAKQSQFADALAGGGHGRPCRGGGRHVVQNKANLIPPEAAAGHFGPSRCYFRCHRGADGIYSQASGRT